MKLGGLLLLVAATAAAYAAAPVPRGFDPGYPKALAEFSYRQSRLNATLKRLGFPYRIYRSAYDGSCFAMRLTESNRLESLRYIDDDPAKGPALAFGCQRLGAEERQTMTLFGTVFVVERDDEAVFFPAADPYQMVARLDKKSRRLEVKRREFLLDALRWAHPNRPRSYVALVQRRLAEKVHASGGGEFVELSAQEQDGKWRYWVKTSDQLAGDPPYLFFEDGRPSP